VLLAAGGAIKFITAYQTSYAAWLWLSIVYALLFMPTLSLTNSLALAHLSDPKRQFPGVRAVGTMAWIVVAWLFPMVWLQSGLEFRWLPPFFAGQELPNAPARMIDSVRVAGLVSIGYALFCWFGLPRVPPRREAAKTLALAKAVGLLRHRSFAILVAATLALSIIHCFYFVQMSKFLASIGLADAYIMPAMSLGQFAEILALALLGPVLARWGFRTVISLGGLLLFPEIRLLRHDPVALGRDCRGPVDPRVLLRFLLRRQLHLRGPHRPARHPLLGADRVHAGDPGRRPVGGRPAQWMALALVHARGRRTRLFPVLVHGRRSRPGRHRAGGDVVPR
jgi:hypothetical protein